MKDLLTTQEVAEEMGLTSVRIRQLILAGKLPAEKFGKANMIRRRDLKLLDGRCTGRPKREKAA